MLRRSTPDRPRICPGSGADRPQIVSESPPDRPRISPELQIGPVRPQNLSESPPSLPHIGHKSARNRPPRSPPHRPRTDRLGPLFVNTRIRPRSGRTVLLHGTKTGRSLDDIAPLTFRNERRAISQPHLAESAEHITCRATSARTRPNARHWPDSSHRPKLTRARPK